MIRDRIKYARTHILETEKPPNSVMLHFLTRIYTSDTQPKHEPQLSTKTI